MAPLCSLLTVGFFSGVSVPSGPVEQDGPSEIKIVITNHCPDCTMINVDGQVQGHFDINHAPSGWNNPKIYYKQVDSSECMSGASQGWSAPSQGFNSTPTVK